MIPDLFNIFFIEVVFFNLFYFTLLNLDCPLPEEWKQGLPKPDQTWVSRALFKWSSRGRPELDISKVNKLWWYPPQPALTVNQPLAVNKYFTQRLFVWMPRKWQVKLSCPHAKCDKHPLTSAGLYPHLRQVLDLDGYYSLVTEYLECLKCKRKVISWSQAILNQLDVGQRRQFPIIIAYNYACDMRVVRLKFLQESAICGCARLPRHHPDPSQSLEDRCGGECEHGAL